MKVNHEIILDGKKFIMEVEGTKHGDEVYIDANSAIQAQINLALKILMDLSDAKDISFEIFNFLLDTTGLRVKEIARYVGMSPAHISQYRRDKHLSSGVWQMFRIFFWDFFTHGKVTIPVFQWNKDAA
jgi:hypothetical protein